MTTTTLQIPGMKCGGCAGRVERALRALPGVEAAASNLANRSVRVDHAAPLPDLIGGLAKAGYPAAVAETRLALGGMHCASCVGRVEAALLAVPGVVSAHVNLADRSARVRHAEGALAEGALERAVRGAGYEATADARAPEDRHAAEMAAARGAFLLAAVLALPVVVLEMGHHWVPALAEWIHHTLGMRTSWTVQAVLTALVLAGPGRGFFAAGLPALARRAPDMNSLVALGTGAAFVYSATVLAAPQILPETARAVYFEAAAAVVTLVLLGRWLEARARGQAGAAIARLAGLAPQAAEVIRDGVPVTLPLAQVAKGDLLRLRPGERVAVDGVVTEGESWIDESMISGEPVPVAKRPGAAVTGGTVNGGGAITYRATAVGADTVLARIIRMVEDAQATKLPIQALVDRVTLWFVPAVMVLAALAVLAWLVFGPSPALTQALVAGVSVLVIACPCAMGLATPTSIMVGTGRAAELGVLFRRGDALQRLEGVRAVAFDKTGTLTEGRPVLTDLEAAPGWEGAAALALAAGAEARSEHPVARAIVAAARERGLELPAAEAVTAEVGRGLRAVVAGRRVLAGAPRWIAEEGVETAPLAAAAARLAAQGRTPVMVAVDGQAAALIGVADRVKPGARAAVAALREQGLVVAMISGDAEAAARAVAAELGIEEVVAEVRPDGKVAALERLRAAHGPVAFVGDGINDAPALAAADAGLAMGTGTDVAIDSADAVVMAGDPRGVATAVALSRATMRNIRQNLGWAFGYNVLLIPVAAGLLVPFGGPMLSPMLAGGAMAASSVCVVANALRLRRAGAPPVAGGMALRMAPAE